ncbi:hypothetical protein CVT24_002872 [Panaeolus cyanescens]|uniref:HMG box domain-containing protein n=1 Tax=Panaeolus cyanescens TaxID=181874 RepID=A0A409YRL5_9AGAR|nr:hypothetical protein CVT24_002872 [Panaeolus cyanescens]
MSHSPNAYTFENGYNPQSFNINASPRVATTTLVGQPLSNLSKQLRAANEANSPSLSPIDNVLFGYPSTPTKQMPSSSSSSCSTPDLSPVNSLASPTFSNGPSTPEQNLYNMNNQFHSMHSWGASSSSSNPPSPLSLSPAMAGLSLDPHHHQHQHQISMFTTPTHTAPDPAPPAKKIPRPPNAFLLFRSDFLKQGKIPAEAERKQQVMSVVIGEIWRFMPDEERALWHKKADEVLAEHAKKYPGYKFSPSPKGSKKKAGMGAGGTREKDDESQKARHARRLREEYTPYHGPSPVSSRRRKGKKAHSVDGGKPARRVASGSGSGEKMEEEGARGEGMTFAQPAPVHFSTYAAMATGQQQAHPYHPVHPSPLRNAVPRRPSTSMGFTEAHKEPAFPYPDTRDMRINAARNAANGEQFPMHNNLMVHSSPFDMFQCGLVPVQAPSTPQQNQQFASSVSEPASSPTTRYNNMFNDPENPLGPQKNASSSSSASTSAGGSDLTNFYYEGQAFNISKALDAPIESRFPSVAPPSSPSSMSASSPPASSHANTNMSTSPSSTTNTLTLDMEYPSPMSNSPAPSSQITSDDAWFRNFLGQGGQDAEMSNFGQPWNLSSNLNGGDFLMGSDEGSTNVNVELGESL